MSKEISVVICHHRGEFVDKAIQSIIDGGEDVEIIIVTSDYSATPRLKGKFPQITVVEQQGGPSHKRNMGSRFASGKYFFFLDDDVEVTPFFFKEMVKGLDMENVGMVYGKTLNMERRNHLDNAGSFLTWTGFLYAREESGILDKGQFDEYEDVFAGKGACMALRRSTFRKVGGFDPNYEILAEETDISWKVWFIGERVLWVPKAILFHAFNTKYKPWNYYYTNKRVYLNGCRNYIAMLLIHLEWKNILRILPFHILVWFCASLGMLFTGKWEASLCILKGIAYNFSEFKRTMWRRRKAQQLRKFSDKTLFQKIMRNPHFSFYWKRFLLYVREGRHG